MFTYNERKGSIMNQLVISGTNYSMLLDVNWTRGDNLYQVDFIYLDPFCKPRGFDSQICNIHGNDIRTIHIGDIGEYLTAPQYKKPTWKQIFPYCEHNIELATLLGIEKPNKARVFGNKIGEQTISLRDTDIGFQRGDDLLIQIDNGYQYKLVRNINQELLKYKLQQQMAKKL